MPQPVAPPPPAPVYSAPKPKPAPISELDIESLLAPLSQTSAPPKKPSGPPCCVCSLPIEDVSVPRTGPTWVQGSKFCLFGVCIHHPRRMPTLMHEFVMPNPVGVCVCIQGERKIFSNTLTWENSVHPVSVMPNYRLPKCFECRLPLPFVFSRAFDQTFPKSLTPEKTNAIFPHDVIYGVMILFCFLLSII